MTLACLTLLLAPAGAAAPQRMSPDDYLLLGYALGLTVLLGYAVNLWLVDRALRKRERRDD